MPDYDQYLDKLCYEALWYAYVGNSQTAIALLNQSVNMWDGKGFADKPFQLSPGNGYATYKLALFYYTARLLGKVDALSFKDTLLTTIKRLQSSNGGFRTAYYYDGNGAIQSQSSTNTETTSLVLIALNYEPKSLPPQMITFHAADFDQTTSITIN
jgi:YD repeat-containing protein